MNFEDLKLHTTFLRAVTEIGYTVPTSVQIAAIPAALTGQDLCVCAQTGSGKTAAFLLPSLSKIASERSTASGKGPRILVITPTRELAQQVEDNAKAYGQYMKWLRTVTLVGGTSYGTQIRSLSKPIDIVIATPGRLLDHLKQGRMDFSRLEVLILDEADRMLDMGFIDDIKQIISEMPKERQTLLFSATLDGEIGKLAKGITHDAKRIDIERTETHGKISETLYYCDDFRHKIRLLDHLLRDTSVDQAVVFTSTKAMSEELADMLHEKGYNSECLHGDMPQNSRNRTLKNLHNGRIKILVATDVAARGIDVVRISHVFNFDLPKQAEDYVHRIGRTGRAGRHGQAITFAEVREYTKIHQIERYLKRKFDEEVIEGMEPTRKRSAPGPKNSRGKKPFGKKGFAQRNRTEGGGKPSSKSSFKPRQEGRSGKPQSRPAKSR